MEWGQGWSGDEEECCQKECRRHVCGSSTAGFIPTSSDDEEKDMEFKKAFASSMMQWYRSAASMDVSTMRAKRIVYHAWCSEAEVQHRRMSQKSL
jgi:hypothetical protein